MRVLIVDDHPGFRHFARELLAEAGYVVVGEAGDGLEALRMARELAPDVVLLDIQLPQCDGFEVARALSEHPAPPRVVLVSTRGADSFGARIAASPAAAFVTKHQLTPGVLSAALA